MHDQTNNFNTRYANSLGSTNPVTVQLHYSGADPLDPNPDTAPSTFQKTNPSPHLSHLQPTPHHQPLRTKQTLKNPEAATPITASSHTQNTDIAKLQSQHDYDQYVTSLRQDHDRYQARLKEL